MSLANDSNCMTDAGATLKSLAGARACGGGLIFTGGLSFQVTPDDTDISPFLITYVGIAGVVKGKLYTLTIRSHEDGENGLAAMNMDPIDDLRWFEDRMFTHIDVVARPAEMPNPESKAYSTTLAYMDPDINALQNTFNTLIDTNFQGGDLAYAENEDILIVLGSNYIPSESEGPLSLNIAKVQAIDEDYDFVGFFNSTGVERIGDGGTSNEKITEFGSTVVVTGYAREGDDREFYAIYSGGNIWNYLDKAGDPNNQDPIIRPASNEIVQLEIAIKGLNAGIKLNYLFIGGHNLYVWSEDFGFQTAIAGVDLPPSPQNTFYDLLVHDGQLVFRQIYEIEGNPNTDQWVMWDGENFTNLDDTRIGGSMVSAHHVLHHSSATPTGNQNELLSKWRKSDNTFQFIKIKTPRVKDSTVEFSGGIFGKIFEMPIKFRPKNPALAGTDWVIEDIPVPIIPIP